MILCSNCGISSGRAANTIFAGIDIGEGMGPISSDRRGFADGIVF